MQDELESEVIVGQEICKKAAKLHGYEMNNP